MYLDPGSWSLFLQVIMGALLAVPFLVLAYWKRVKAFFTRKKDEDEDEDESNGK